MHRSLISAAAFAALTTLSAVAHAAEDSSTSVSTILDETMSQLREDFNRAKGSVRLLFVVDPVCPGCLRGLDDINKVLLANTRDPRLRTFVVHVPVLKPAAQAKDIPPAAKLLHNPNVHHYWNPSGSFGRALAEAVGLKHDDELVYAWDVWLIYDPETTWEGVSPPKPQRLMHQLRALRGSKQFPYLDRDAFARDVHELLAQLPRDTISR